MYNGRPKICLHCDTVKTHNPISKWSDTFLYKETSYNYVKQSYEYDPKLDEKEGKRKKSDTLCC